MVVVKTPEAYASSVACKKISFWGSLSILAKKIIGSIIGGLNRTPDHFWKKWIANVRQNKGECTSLPAGQAAGSLIRFVIELFDGLGNS